MYSTYEESTRSLSDFMNTWRNYNVKKAQIETNGDEDQKMKNEDLSVQKIEEFACTEIEKTIRQDMDETALFVSFHEHGKENDRKLHLENGHMAQKVPLYEDRAVIGFSVETISSDDSDIEAKSSYDKNCSKDSFVSLSPKDPELKDAYQISKQGTNVIGIKNKPFSPWKNLLNKF